MKMNRTVAVFALIFMLIACSQYSPDDLHNAVKAHDVKLVEKILDAGIPIDSVNQEGQSPLMVTAYLGKVELLNLLLEKGADIDFVDETGRSALVYAVSGGQAQSILALLSGGANVNLADVKENAPLHFAAKLGDSRIVSVLLVNGADVHRLNKKGRSPLMVAGRNEQQGNVRTLLIHQGSDEDDLYYHRLLINMIAKRDFKTVKAIFREIGSNTNVSHNGRTALMEAAYQGDARIVNFLLSYPIENIDFFEAGGLTALGEATLQGHTDIVKVLVGYGASPEAGATSALKLAELSDERAALMGILMKSAHE